MTARAAPDPTPGAVTAPDASTAEPHEVELSATATLPWADVLAELGSSDAGLSSAEASRRLGIYGPNVLAAHGVSAWSVLARQLRSYLLLLLLVAAVVSAVVGDLTEALIIGAIMAMSIGLSFFNEYRSEKAVEELHSEIKHLAAVDRDGAAAESAVAQLVPGDVVHLRVGDVIPADLRLLEVHELECDESVLTGESRASEKTAEAQPPGDSPLDLGSCAFMGTLVTRRRREGVVVRTGSRTAFGAIAVRLGERQGVTAFQQGLQDFSRLLATVTAVLAGSIFVINAVLGRSLLQSALFALAIAVGLTPQLLAGDRDRQPLDGRPPAGQETRDRQTSGRDRGPRQRPGAVHGQDRHPDRGSDLVHAGARPHGQARRSRSRARSGVQRQDRQRARPCALGHTAGYPRRQRSDAARPPALRPRAPTGLGPRRHADGTTADLQGRAGSRSRSLHDRPRRGAGDSRRPLRVGHASRRSRKPPARRRPPQQG